MKTTKIIKQLTALAFIASISSVSFAGDNKAVYVTDALTGNIVKMNTTSIETEVLNRNSPQVLAMKSEQKSNQLPSAFIHYEILAED